MITFMYKTSQSSYFYAFVALVEIKLKLKLCVSSFVRLAACVCSLHAGKGVSVLSTQKLVVIVGILCGHFDLTDCEDKTGQ